MTHAPIGPFARIEGALRRLPAGRFALWTALAGIAWCLFWYCPRYENWNRGYPYSWETFRGANFLMQCADPLRGDVEPAVRWRLLLPGVCHILHLGTASLLLPWTGVLSLFAIIAYRLDALGFARCETLLAVLLAATTSAGIIGLHWLGVNDAWVWAGLCHVTLGASPRARAAWCLLGPWIDERFVIGLPLAAVLRGLVRAPANGVTLAGLLKEIGTGLLWCAPYILVRAACAAAAAKDPSSGFAAWTLAHLHEWLPHAHEGWWHGLRAGWSLVVALLCVALARFDTKTNILLWLGVLATLLF
ncbi:MAG TPA: hypothetical protein VM029_21460, partial [Opitutaceae bacterium]|nr:hypothetical protein [Opitutaceae bacterium]